MRDDMVEPGGIVRSPDGRLWRVAKADDAGVDLRLMQGEESIRLTWGEWEEGWELVFP